MATWLRANDSVINLAMVEQIQHSTGAATEDGAYWTLRSPRCNTLVTKANDPEAYAIILGFLRENVAAH